MREKGERRSAMQVGDRILINKGIAKKVLIVARVDIPHSTEKAFATKSGGDFTIGLKVWKSDYVWNEKSQMWVPKG
ncbi:hypothetical protein EPO44_07625 [bacterium]|nr:MAG: hypothetical protein EPO44_07625 [bacterium]